MAEEPVMVREQNTALSVAGFMTVGDRSEQQDCFAYRLDDAGIFALICDGMGGMQAGGLAARTAAQTVLEKQPETLSLSGLLEAVKAADRAVSALKAPDGGTVSAGSTLVSVLVRDRELSWCSVGDSRAYLFRGGELAQFTKDQNYRAVLEEQLRQGLISEAYYRQESVRGDALISYLGTGELELIDHNSSPFPLRSGDGLILMSDGLYRLVTDEEIRSIMEVYPEPEEILRELEKKAAANAEAAGLKRDNMTVTVIKMR